MADESELPYRERMAFYAAKRVYLYADVPFSELDRTTWRQWFEKRYGESLDAFRARARTEKLRQRVKKFELDSWGFTLADEPPGSTDKERLRESPAYCSRCAAPRFEKFWWECAGGWSGRYTSFGFPEMLCAACFEMRDRDVEAKKIVERAARGRIARAKKEIEERLKEPT